MVQHADDHGSRSPHSSDLPSSLGSACSPGSSQPPTSAPPARSPSAAAPPPGSAAAASAPIPDDAPSPAEDRDRTTPLDHWEQRYGESEAMWSGMVNATLASALAHLPPGRSIDLGCGEGADVLWLAEHGWEALGLDLSPTAIRRARAAGSSRSASSRSARFEQCDLSRWEPDPASVDLVTASFFHSNVALDRVTILRRAADAVAPGGRLVILSHAAPPPWASGLHHHGERMLSAQEEKEQLALPDAEWDVELAEQRGRETTGPDGAATVLEDSLLILRRRPTHE